MTYEQLVTIEAPKKTLVGIRGWLMALAIRQGVNIAACVAMMIESSGDELMGLSIISAAFVWAFYLCVTSNPLFRGAYIGVNVLLLLIVAVFDPAVFIGIFFWECIVFAYLFRSKRVRETYGYE